MSLRAPRARPARPAPGPRLLRHVSLAAALLSLLAVAAARAGPADVADWDGVRWGMTAAQLRAALGPRLRRLKTRLEFRDASVGLALPGHMLAGHEFTALFQMDRSAGRLQQILLERRRGYAKAIAFDRLARDFVRRFGPPARGCDSRDKASPTVPVLRQRMWVRGATTMHLSLIDLTVGVMFDDSRLDIDPLLPAYKRRLYHRNLMARRLLVRYHPSSRRDLARLRCEVTVRKPP